MIDILTGASVRLAVPILLAAQGELLTERAGVVNVGLEAFLLAGAFSGAAVAAATGSLALGFLAGMLSSVFIALLFCLFALWLRTNQVVVGTALNLLALGGSGFLFRWLFGQKGKTLLVQVLPPLPFPPAWKEIPFFGAVLSNLDLLTLGALLLIPLLWILLEKTRWGLQIDACGEYPRAAESTGIRVNRTRVLCVLFSGVLGGLGGCFLSLVHTGTFIENMANGRGFIALAIVIFGRWSPWGVAGAAWFFGFLNALQFHLQVSNAVVPYQFFLMLPYLLTLGVLAGFVTKVSPPAALGQPYPTDG